MDAQPTTTTNEAAVPYQRQEDEKDAPEPEAPPAEPQHSHSEAAASEQPAEDVVINVSSTADAECTDCIICYEPLDSAAPGVERLACGHSFHASCIEEWLEKDGRCPICRHQVREVDSEAARSQRHIDIFHEVVQAARDTEVLNRLRPWQLASLMLSSRRLMTLAALEGLLSAMVIGYDQDVLSPLMMLLTASITFHGASQFHIGTLALARLLLALSAFTHLYLLLNVVHDRNARTSFAAAEDSRARAALIVLAIVTSLELTILRKTTGHMLQMRCFSEVELARLRLLRRTPIGWKHRAVVAVLTLVIVLPVALQHMCERSGSAHARALCEGDTSYRG